MGKREESALVQSLAVWRDDAVAEGAKARLKLALKLSLRGAKMGTRWLTGRWGEARARFWDWRRRGCYWGRGSCQCQVVVDI